MLRNLKTGTGESSTIRTTSISQVENNKRSRKEGSTKFSIPVTEEAESPEGGHCYPETEH